MDVLSNCLIYYNRRRPAKPCTSVRFRVAPPKHILNIRKSPPRWAFFVSVVGTMAGLAIRNHAVVGKGSVHQAGLGVGSVEQVFGVIQYKVLPPCRKLRYHQLCQSSFVPATEVCLESNRPDLLRQFRSLHLVPLTRQHSDRTVVLRQNRGDHELAIYRLPCIASVAMNR